MGKRIQKKKIIKEIFWFLLKFNLLLIPFYAIIYFDVNFYLIQELFANLIGYMLRIFGYSANISGFFIHVGDLSIDISRDCIGWKSAYSLFALVLASPGKLKKKLSFLGIWVPIFFLFNIFRVFITIIVGLEFDANYLKILHNIVWQEAIILGIVGVWYLWMRKEIFKKKIKELNKKKQ